MLDTYIDYMCNASREVTNGTTLLDVGNCYQLSVFIWLPCFIYAALTPFWIRGLNRLKENFYQIKVAWLLIIKIVVTLCLIFNELISVTLKTDHFKKSYYSSSHADYLHFIILSISLLFVLFINHWERVKGQTTSGFLLCYWTTLTISSLIIFYSRIVQYSNDQIDLKSQIHFLVYLFFVTVNFLLVLFCVDKSHVSIKTRTSGFSTTMVSNFSRLTFWYMTKLIIKGNKGDISHDDLKTIDDNFLSDDSEIPLQKEWTRVANEYFEKCRIENNRIIKYQDDETVKFVKKKPTKKKVIKQPSLAWCVFKMFPAEFLGGAILKLSRDVFLFLGPYVLGKLITFVKERNQTTAYGLFLAFAMATLFFAQAIVFNQYFDRMFKFGSKLRTTLTDLIYKESMILSNNARRTATIGQMINIVAVNAQSFNEFPHYFNMTWSCLMNIIACIFILGKILNPTAAIAGFVAMVIFIPFNSFITNKSKMKQILKLKLQDSRLKNINEILNGIKIIKFYAWEISYETIVAKIRLAELVILKYISFLNAIQSFSWIISPFLVSLVSFSIFLFSSDENVLDAKTAFTSIAIFNLLKQPLAMLPMTISNMIQAHVSFKRLQEFLLNETIDQTMITHQNIPNESLVLEDCNFGWSHDELLLKDVDLRIKTGSLTAIVGSVGSGKSSLLAACLGEMEKLAGNINVYGTTAYAPQLAWVQNATLRDNILFGKQYDEEFYNQVIEVCALKTDISLLEAGDLTEIGEKGINLSGGQKQRINIARCIYANTDIYFLDDSLSAVDAHVGKHIFEKAFGPNGILQNKTRLFVTNSLNFLPMTDEILYIENGSILEKGHYDELIENESLFNQFIQTYLKTKENNTESIDKIQSDNNSSQNIIKIRKESIKIPIMSKVNGTIDTNIIKKEKSVNKSTYPAILQYFKACNIKLVTIFLLLYSLSFVAQIFGNFWLSDLSNNYEKFDSTKSKLINYGVYFILGFVSCMVIFFADFLFVWMFIRASKNLHESMLDSILKCNMKFFESTPVGRIINRFSKDIDVTEKMIPEAFKNTIRNGLQVLTILLVLTVIFPFILIALVPIFFLYFSIQRFYAKTARQLKRLESVSRSPIYSLFGESLNGISTIRAFKAEKRFLSQMRQHLNDNMTLYLYDMTANRWLGLRLELTGTLIILSASLFTVLQRENITPGKAGLSISYALTLSSILMWTVRSFTDFETNLISVERITEYCEMPEEVKEKPWIIEEKRPLASWPDKGAIQFQNFSFKYRKELNYALRDLSFQIIGGEKIGIVGRTGAGKSSLSIALFRLLEESVGKILIDGLDITSIGLHDLRKNLTIIPQDPVLFSGSIKMNLDPFGNYTEAQLWLALEKTHLKEYVMNQENKLLFECAEGGENLSFGQRQLICLARALLRKTNILILDEATAAIDHNTDDLVQKLIKLEFAECTVLTIAHRLNTILDSDRIMVLSQGCIAEFDTPSNLLSNENSYFYSMANSADLINSKPNT